MIVDGCKKTLAVRRIFAPQKGGKKSLANSVMFK
jgi:hypothetical protein